MGSCASRIVPMILILSSVAWAQTSQPADHFQAESGWSGFQKGDERVQNTRNQQDRPARFLILTRDGEKFTAQYYVQLLAGIHGIEVEGIIRNNQIVMQPKRVIRGANWENGILDRPWQGKIDGEKLILERTTDQHLTITATLTFDPNVTPGNIAGASGRGRGRGAAGRAGRGARRGLPPAPGP